MMHLDLANHTCVIRTANGEILTSDEQGIRPPLRWLRENPAVLRDAEVADKVIGKAAALLFAYGCVKSVWAARMSEAARDFLRAAGIAYEYGELVPVILNRDGTGLCPMEQKGMDIDDPARAFALFDGMIAK